MAYEKILIVEDEALAAMEIEARLIKLGYRISGIVSTGEAAVAAVHETMPALVLMDIVLAGEIDGIRAADEVRRRFNVPVVFLTAYTDERTLKRAKLAEPFGYLMKPFEEKDLHTTIEVALYKHSMEKKLRESELRYRTLFEGASDAIFILDAEDGDAGLIVDANQAAANMHGYTIDELRGLNIRDLDSPDAAGEATGLMDRILQGEWIKKEISHRRKDNTIFSVEISAGPLVFDNHKYILAIDRDISERRNADEALKAALARAEDEKNKTEAIIAAMGDGISIQDTDFKVLYQNQVHKDIIGDHTGEYCYNAYERKKDVCEGCGIAGSFKDGKIHKVQRSAMTDRGMVYVEVTASPVRDSSGRIIAGIEIVRNIDERRKFEMELRESEERYRDLFENAGDLIQIVTPDGRFLYVNRSWRETLGYSEGEVSGLTLFDIIDPKCEGHCHSTFDRILSECRIDPLETVFITKDGRKVILEGSASCKSEEGKVVSVRCMFHDVTARKEAEQKILQSYELQTVLSELLSISLKDLSLGDLLWQALDLIISLSWLSLEAKGSIHLVQDEPGMLMMMASKDLPDQLLKECSKIPFGRCLCGRAALTHAPQFADCVDDRHDIAYEGMGPHGHYCIPIISAGEVLGVMNLYLKAGHRRDEGECNFLKAYANVLAGIVQRKRAEEERSMLILKLQDAFETVTRSQKEWMGTFDSITDLIFISDVNYTIIRANRAFAEYFEMTPRQVIYKKCYELFNMTELRYSACPHATSLREQRMVQGEFVDQARGKTFMMTASPYFSQEVGLVGSIISCKDVTEEKEREMRLIMSERLASLGQMASSIAHEINNPLAAIAGCTEGLLSRVGQERFEPELFRNYLNIIGEEILRCKNITSGMLSFVRKTTYDKQDVDIHKTLDKTIEIIGFQGRLKEVELIKDYTEGLPLIRGSEGEIRQVFLAIIINALDAMEDRGKLTLETGVEGENIFIKITDVGPGISPEQQSRIFDPFYTTKGEKGGTGLGLSIANKIVNNHRGTIEVSSEEGNGTAFIITLPI